MKEQRLNELELALFQRNVAIAQTIEHRHTLILVDEQRLQRFEGELMERIGKRLNIDPGSFSIDPRTGEVVVKENAPQINGNGARTRTGS